MSKKLTERAAKVELLDTLVDEVITGQSGSLDSWNSFCEELKIPADIYPAMMTGRPELLTLAQPRELSKDECKVMYDLLRNLIRTNMALQKHAEKTAQLVNNWAGAFRQLESVGQNIQRFANFEPLDETEEEANNA